MHNFLLSRFTALNAYRRKTQLCFLQQNAFSLICSFTSKANAQLQALNRDPFTVDYLINSCGLPRKTAIQASKYLRLKNSDTADSVLTLLKKYGFSERQVSEIVKRRPTLLLSDPEETLLPKLKFFESKGISSTDLKETVVSNPLLLKKSLRQFLIPRYEILKSVLSDDAKVIQALKCTIRSSGSGGHIVPNIKLLREVGVPQHFIYSLATGFPDVVVIEPTKFAEAVKSAKEMGFNTAKSAFVMAVQVFAKMRQSEWESKFKAFERWGWSRDVSVSAFKKCPNCMLMSLEKIRKVMSFLVNEMGFSALDIAEFPVVLSYSLEKRIIPRCLLVRTLKSKGLLKNDLRLSSFIVKTNKKFACLYATRFQDLHDPQMRPFDFVQPK